MKDVFIGIFQCPETVNICCVRTLWNRDVSYIQEGRK